MKRIICLIAVVFALTPLRPAVAFNLWTDIQQNTQWTLGQSVEAGTAIVLKDVDSANAKAGQFVGSALASVVNYRMINLAAGGTFIPQANGALKAFDTGKVGLNLGYFLSGFANEPPAIIKNLVFGPSLSTTLVTTPHVLIPSFDFNIAFGGGSIAPKP